MLQLRFNTAPLPEDVVRAIEGRKVWRHSRDGSIRASCVRRSKPSVPACNLLTATAHKTSDGAATSPIAFHRRRHATQTHNVTPPATADAYVPK